VPRLPPRQGYFNVVTCPHYVFEIISWILFNMLHPTVPGIAFTIAGYSVMVSYATERNDQYQEIARENDKIKIPKWGMIPGYV